MELLTDTTGVESHLKGSRQGNVGSVSGTSPKQMWVMNAAVSFCHITFIQ